MLKMDDATFLGKPFDYWIELDARMRAKNSDEVIGLFVDALVENVKLKRRLDFIEGNGGLSKKR